MVAEPFFKVADEPIPLEGPAFDRHGNLLFVDIYASRVLRLSVDQQLETVYAEPGQNFSGIAVHQDGRIFVAAVGPRNGRGTFDVGTIFAIAPDGSGRQTVIGPTLGYVTNDLVFDRQGGFYFTDFRGSSTQASGGVYFLGAGDKDVQPVLPGMCGANGIALSPDEKVLWSTEFSACKLHRVELSAAATVPHTGTSVPYHFTGPGADSMRTDAEGNVYVAMNRQGRVLVFSPYGMPIGQILLPGRERNHFLRSTSLALSPDSQELFIVSRDEVGGGGAMIFKAGGFAAGARLFSHQ